MARVDHRLSVCACGAEEGCLREKHVHCVHATCICCLINQSDCLIQHKEEEADEAGQRVVCRVTLGAFVNVVDIDLESEGAAEQYSVDYSEDPR